MDDIHATTVIKGLLGELERCIALVAAQNAVITQNVGDTWDTQIEHFRRNALEDQREEFARLLQKMLYDAPESNPSGEWQTGIQRLVESAKPPEENPGEPPE
jgi:hypothetical protein